jgi:hypothetical protein
MEAVPSEPGTCSRQRYGHGHGHGHGHTAQEIKLGTSPAFRNNSCPDLHMQLSEVCSAVVHWCGTKWKLARMAHHDSGPPSSPTPLVPQDIWTRPPPAPLSSSQRHVSQEMSLGRSILLLEQQPFLASAAWSKISSTWGIWRFISFPAAAVADCSF